MNEKTVDQLREEGCCVVVFNQDELNGASPDDVATRLIELGWDVIDSLKDPWVMGDMAL